MQPDPPCITQVELRSQLRHEKRLKRFLGRYFPGKFTPPRRSFRALDAVCTNRTGFLLDQTMHHLIGKNVRRAVQKNRVVLSLRQRNMAFE